MNIQSKNEYVKNRKKELAEKYQIRIKYLADKINSLLPQAQFVIEEKDVIPALLVLMYFDNAGYTVDFFKQKGFFGHTGKFMITVDTERTRYGYYYKSRHDLNDLFSIYDK